MSNVNVDSATLSRGSGNASAADGADTSGAAHIEMLVVTQLDSYTANRPAAVARDLVGVHHRKPAQSSIGGTGYIGTAAAFMIGPQRSFSLLIQAVKSSGEPPAGCMARLSIYFLPTSVLRTALTA